jgi:hypothetical protein
MMLRFSSAGAASVFGLVVAACASPTGGAEAQGNAASAVSVNSEKVEGQYFLTTFGGPDDSGDNGKLACGGSSDPNSDDPHEKYYAAAKQRFGCGAHIKLEANGKCIVLETTDEGPAAWVEDKAGGPIIDATPLAAQELFGEGSFGWSDKKAVQLTIADDSTPLGPCTAGGGGSATPSTGDDDDSSAAPSTGGDDPTQTPPAQQCDPTRAAAACRAAKANGAECGRVPDECSGTVSCEGQPGFGCADGQTCSQNHCQN